MFKGNDASNLPLLFAGKNLIKLPHTSIKVTAVIRVFFGLLAVFHSLPSNAAQDGTMKPLSQPPSCYTVPDQSFSNALMELRSRQQNDPEDTVQSRRHDAGFYRMLKSHRTQWDDILHNKQLRAQYLIDLLPSINPRSQLNQIIDQNVRINQAQQAQLKNVLAVIQIAETVAQAREKLLTADWPEASLAYRLVMGDRSDNPFEGWYLSSYLSPSGIGQVVVSNASFKHSCVAIPGNYSPKLGARPFSEADNQGTEFPKDEGFVLARDLLSRVAGWQRISGVFSIHELPLVSQRIEKVIWQQIDIGTVNVWSRASFQYDATQKTLTLKEYRRIKPGSYMSRGPQLQTPQESDNLSGNDYTKIRNQILTP